MEFKEFRNNTKVVVNEELVRSIVEAFVTSNIPFYNEKTSLMACFDKDPNCEGKVDPNENEKFIGLLMLNMCYDKCQGKSEFLKLSKDDRVKMGGIFYRRIKKQIFECGQVVYDASGVNQDNDYADMEHEFIIKTLPENFINVLSTLYESIRVLGLKDVRIVTPSTRFICAGYNAPIKIRCKSDYLTEVVDLLEQLKDRLASEVLPVPLVYNITGSWYGYEQVNKEGITAPSLLANAVYGAIQVAMEAYKSGGSDLLMSDGTPAKEYYENENNKFLATKRIIACALDNDYEQVMSQLFELTKSKLSELNVNIADCLRFASVNEELKWMYGEESDIDLKFKIREMEQANLPKVPPLNPHVMTKSEEEIRLDELAKQSEEDYRKSLLDRSKDIQEKLSIISKVSQANIDAKKRIEDRKRELEEIISRGNNFPSNYQTEEDMDRALSAIQGEEEIRRDSAFTNKDYSAQLGASLFSVLNGADPSGVSEYNDAIEELGSLHEQEKQETVDFEKSALENETVLEEVPSIGLDDESLETVDAPVDNGSSLDNSLDSLTRMSNGIDAAIRAIELNEENEKRAEEMKREAEMASRKDLSKLDIPDISRRAVPNFDPSKIQTITLNLGENNELSGFASEKENGVKEASTDVQSNLGQSQVVSQVSQEETVKVKKKGPERSRPDSLCLDYTTEDDVLIPDLRSVAYSGDDLVGTLSAGGNYSDLDYIRSIAKHFGLDNYTGTKEQDKKILDILKNLDKYEMDGTSKDTGLKPLAENQVVVTNQQQTAPEDSKREIPLEERLMASVNPTITPLDIEYNPKLRDSYKYKYSGYVDDTSILDSYVAGTDYTVLDYFMYFDIFGAYRADAIFVLHEGGVKVTGKEFTMNYLIQYLINYGPEDLGTIASYFAEEILPPEKKANKGR